MTPRSEPRQTKARPRSGIVVPHRPPWHGRLAAGALWAFGNVLSATWRVTIEDQSGLMETPSRPLLAAIWHNRLALAIPVWKEWQKKNPNAKLAALISASRDGALLATVLSYSGIKAIRGSSSRRGAQAMLELTSAVEENYNVAITPDGPRGPKYQVQAGIISLAQITGSGIIPIGIRVNKKKELRSWDRFQVPLPFARCAATFGPIMHVPADATPERHEQARLALQATLLSLNPD